MFHYCKYSFSREFTKNHSEYCAFTAGLTVAREDSLGIIHIHRDSKLVSLELIGEWRVNNEQLKALS